MFKLLRINKLSFIEKVLKFFNIMALVETYLYVIFNFILGILIRDIIYILFIK